MHGSKDVQTSGRRSAELIHIDFNYTFVLRTIPRKWLALKQQQVDIAARVGYHQSDIGFVEAEGGVAVSRAQRNEKRVCREPTLYIRSTRVIATQERDKFFFIHAHETLRGALSTLRYFNRNIYQR